jgi:hypothetical protein
VGADGGENKQCTLDVSNTDKGLIVEGMLLVAQLNKHLSYHFYSKNIMIHNTSLEFQLLVSRTFFIPSIL